MEPSSSTTFAMLRDQPPAYSTSPTEFMPPAGPVPTYTKESTSGEIVLSPTPSSSSSTPEWTFKSSHLAVNLGPRLWSAGERKTAASPTYGASATIRGDVAIMTGRGHVERVTVSLKGCAQATVAERGLVAAFSKEEIVDVTEILYSAFAASTSQSCAVEQKEFAMKIPSVIDTRSGPVPLPPSYVSHHLSSHSGAGQAMIQYSLQFDVYRRGRLRRHERLVVPILYLPKSRPPVFPLRQIPRAPSGTDGLGLMLDDRVVNILIRPTWPAGVTPPPAGLAPTLHLTLPAPNCFTSGLPIPVALTLSCPSHPALAARLGPHAHVSLAKRIILYRRASDTLEAPDLSLRALRWTRKERGTISRSDSTDSALSELSSPRASFSTLRPSTSSYVEEYNLNPVPRPTTAETLSHSMPLSHAASRRVNDKHRLLGRARLLCNVTAGQAGKEASFEAQGVVSVEYVIRVRLGPPTTQHVSSSPKEGVDAPSSQSSTPAPKEQEAGEDVEEIDREDDASSPAPGTASEEQNVDWSTAPSFVYEHRVQLTTDIWGTAERELASLGGEPVPALGLWAGGSAHPVGW